MKPSTSIVQFTDSTQHNAPSRPALFHWSLLAGQKYILKAYNRFSTCKYVSH